MYDTKELVCFSCNEIGHMKCSCPSVNKSGSVDPESTPFASTGPPHSDVPKPSSPTPIFFLLMNEDLAQNSTWVCQSSTKYHIKYKKIC